MQFQSDMLRAAISRSNMEEASALGAVVMNGFARGVWKSFREAADTRGTSNPVRPLMKEEQVARLYKGWKVAVQRVIQ